MLLLLAIVASAAAYSSQGPAGNTWTDKGCDQIPICDVAYDGKLAAVKELLGAGAAVDEQDRLGATALLYAATNGHTPVVAALLAAGAIPDLPMARGLTSLHLASANGHRPVVQALLRGGASTGLQDSDGKTALAHAEAQPEDVKALLDGRERFKTKTKQPEKQDLRRRLLKTDDDTSADGDADGDADADGDGGATVLIEAHGPDALRVRIGPPGSPPITAAEERPSALLPGT